MAIKSRTIAPEYCRFYIAGSLDVDIATSEMLTGVIATRKCINVPCLYWSDGDTTVTLGPVSELGVSSAPAYDGFLDTPMQVLLLFDANMPEIMLEHVLGAITRIRVWTNHPTQADRVAIGWG